MLRLSPHRFLSMELAHTEARSPKTTIRAHFNIWWARYGWLLVHLVARLDNQFSRPPYFTAAVNLTAEPIMSRRGVANMARAQSG